MNKVNMIGRAATEPEIRYTNKGDAVANFRIAVDRRFKKEGQTEADFFQTSAFGKTAEFIEKYIRKGQKIGLAGRLQNDEFTDRNGQKITRAVIIIEEIEFCERKETEEPKPEPKPEFLDIPANEELPFNF